MKLYIKNMVCSRCIMVVQTELQKLGIKPIDIRLGEVELAADQATLPWKELEAVLNNYGFELLTDKKRQVTEQIKTAIIELVHYPVGVLKTNLSDHLRERLQLEYASLSAIFSETEHNTIEKFFIQQKIEKVKELLTYGERSLSEIAHQLNYSSVAHLSAQFKKVCGLTPSEYKTDHTARRKPLDEI